MKRFHSGLSCWRRSRRSWSRLNLKAAALLALRFLLVVVYTAWLRDTPQNIVIGALPALCRRSLAAATETSGRPLILF